MEKVYVLVEVIWVFGECYSDVEDQCYRTIEEAERKVFEKDFTILRDVENVQSCVVKTYGTELDEYHWYEILELKLKND